MTIGYRTITRKNAKWKFSLHLNETKGPNRVTYHPDKALNFFKKLDIKNHYKDSLLARATHLETGLFWETDDPEELGHFIDNIVVRTGSFKHD
jgi:hypothetical protein